MKLRHPKTNKPVLNKVAAPAAFGMMVLRCRDGRGFLSHNDSNAIYLGPIVPQVNGTYLCRKDEVDGYKQSVAWFHEAETNCNMCKHLVRVPYTRQHPSLPHPGICGKTQESLWFHPEDNMGKACWEPRV